jgi:GR25 family glycosyltransferase involved in LPS biosynthesis
MLLYYEYKLAILSVIIAVLILVVSLTLAYNTKRTNGYMEPIKEGIFPFKIFIISLESTSKRYQYVTSQLNKLNIMDYQQWKAVDQNKVTVDDMLNIGVTQQALDKFPGCACSHIELWRYISKKKLGWTLILEDDAHFHPEFKNLFSTFWNQVPTDAKMIYLGYGGTTHNHTNPIIKTTPLCTHAYMINCHTANYLLNNILPVSKQIDVAIVDHFKMVSYQGCYLFNGNAYINGIHPNDYKKSHGKACMFDGLVYQNQDNLSY